MITHKHLGDILMEAGSITGDQLDMALREQRHSGERLGNILTRLGFVTEEVIMEVLQFHLGIPRVFLDNRHLDPEVVQLIPEGLARRHMAIPIGIENDRLAVAMADPLNVSALEDLRLAAGREIKPAIAGKEDIEEALNRIWQEETKSIMIEIATAADAAKTGVEGAPVIRLVNSFIKQAVFMKASDIHVEPHDDHVRVRFRVDGLLREVCRLPRDILNPLVSRVKIMAGMDIAEKRLPQDGRFQFSVRKRNIDLRVSSMPTVFGEKIVIRLLDKDAMFLSLDELGFRPDNKQCFNSMIRSTYGMILITGPTGSGKTTTLYAALNTLNSPEKNIITIEDPVEYVLEGINQVRVNYKAGLTFASGIRSILRQDPDIIMVGEIRDRETVDIAVRAATTGHLVFSTLHTNDAAGAVTRLLDMGVETFLVNSSIVGVVAQRLVRKICPGCREAFRPEAGSQEKEWIPDSEILWRGRGCEKCNFSGYEGRTGIHEILVMTQELRELVAAKMPASVIKNAAVNGGMVPLMEDGIEKVKQGITTISEVLRVSLGSL